MSNHRRTRRPHWKRNLVRRLERWLWYPWEWVLVPLLLIVMFYKVFW